MKVDSNQIVALTKLEIELGLELPKQAMHLEERLTRIRETAKGSAALKRILEGKGQESPKVPAEPSPRMAPTPSTDQ